MYLTGMHEYVKIANTIQGSC